MNYDHSTCCPIPHVEENDSKFRNLEAKDWYRLVLVTSHLSLLVKHDLAVLILSLLVDLDTNANEHESFRIVLEHNVFPHSFVGPGLCL